MKKCYGCDKEGTLIKDIKEVAEKIGVALQGSKNGSIYFFKCLRKYDELNKLEEIK